VADERRDARCSVGVPHALSSRQHCLGLVALLPPLFAILSPLGLRRLRPCAVF
jgi:hypothetical protein